MKLCTCACHYNANNQLLGKVEYCTKCIKKHKPICGLLGGHDQGCFEPENKYTPDELIKIFKKSPYSSSHTESFLKWLTTYTTTNKQGFTTEPTQKELNLCKSCGKMANHTTKTCPIEPTLL